MFEFLLQRLLFQKSAILVSLYDLFFFIMSIIDLIVFIILFKYFRGMFVDISEVERALYLIFAGWIGKYNNTLVFKFISMF